jgi:hypothetical protein
MIMDIPSRATKAGLGILSRQVGKISAIWRSDLCYSLQRVRQMDLIAEYGHYFRPPPCCVDNNTFAGVLETDIPHVRTSLLEMCRSPMTSAEQLAISYGIKVQDFAYQAAVPTRKSCTSTRKRGWTDNSEDVDLSESLKRMRITT